MKILVIRFSSIGDIILTTPVVRCLKKQLNAEVHFLTKKGHYAMMADNPYIDRVHALHSSIWTTIDRLKAEKYDIIIDLHHNLRSMIIKTMLGKKSYSFNKLNIEKWLLVNFKIDKLPDEHIVDRYMETCAPLGVVNDEEGLDYFIPEKDEIDIKTLPPAFHDGYLVWVIGAKQRTKQFPYEKIMNVIVSTNMPVVLMGGREDRTNAKAITIGLLKRPNIYNACGEYSINQSASIVRQAKVVISNDTGFMHIAAAFKKKIISIWGNTVPQFGMTPYYGKYLVSNKIMEVYDLPCRPCSKIGRSNCPKGHFRCMREISEPAMVQEANRLYVHD